jgi:hypothetical protein
LTVVDLLSAGLLLEEPMTQPSDTIPTPAASPTAFPMPTVAPTPALTLTDHVLIASELGATLDEARQIVGSLRAFYKMSFPSGEGQQTVAWEVGLPIPGNPGLEIFAAFNVDFLSADTDGLPYVAGDCRFYVIPAASAGPIDPRSPSFVCYTVSRSSPTLVSEKMDLQTFIREVGREWYNLAVVQGVVEEEDDEEEDDK